MGVNSVFKVLVYDRWSLWEIWLQSVSSSISRLRFAEQVPRSLAISTQRSLVEVWLTTVAKIRTIASSYPPRKRSAQNFLNDLRTSIFEDANESHERSVSLFWTWGTAHSEDRIPFSPHSKHDASLLQRPKSKYCLDM